MSNPLKLTFGYRLIKTIHDEFGIGMMLWYLQALCVEMQEIETTDDYDYSELAHQLEKLIKKLIRK